MKVDFTNETVFSFEGPNLCLLGDKSDFEKLSKALMDLTAPGVEVILNLMSLDFIEHTGEKKEIIFSSKDNSNSLGIFDENARLIFELDSRYWERLFKYFVFMSWDKKTYYLNNTENCLNDLDLKQECNFICSSEF